MDNGFIELAKHCIGLGRRKPYTRHGKKFYRPYRNYFATAGSGDDYEAWELMVSAGYAEREESQNQHGGYSYHMTRDGLDWLGNKIGVVIHDEED